LTKALEYGEALNMNKDELVPGSQKKLEFYLGTLYGLNGDFKMGKNIIRNMLT